MKAHGDNDLWHLFNLGRSPSRFSEVYALALAGVRSHPEHAGDLWISPSCKAAHWHSSRILGVMERNQWVAFKPSVEALWGRALRSRMSPRLAKRLEEAGLNLQKEILPAYSYTEFMRFMAITVEELYGPKPTEDQCRELGRLWCDGYFQTLFGTALLAILKVLGPRRTLLRSHQNYRSANNFTTPKVLELSPTHFELWLEDEGTWPGVLEGSLEHTLEVCGAKKWTVKRVRHEGERAVFDLLWEM